MLISSTFSSNADAAGLGITLENHCTSSGPWHRCLCGEGEGSNGFQRKGLYLYKDNCLHLLVLLEQISTDWSSFK